MKPENRRHSEALTNTKKLVLLLQYCVAVSSVFVALGMIPKAAQSVRADQGSAAGRPELVLQTGHAMRVDGLAFSPDGRLLASGSADNTLKLWDTSSKREVRTLAGHTAGIKAVAFRPDGEWLASGGIDGSLKLWEVATGHELRSLGGNGSISSVAFSTDGRWLAAGNMEKTVKLWDLKTGREPLTLMGHAGFITSIAFSPDRRWLASGSADRTIKIWNLESGREQRSLMGHTDRIAALAFSPDGQLLASGSFDTKVKLWKVSDWTEQKLRLESPSRILALAFTPDAHTLISADANRTIRRNDVGTGSELRTIADPAKEDVNEAIAIAFSRDGRSLASSTGDKTVELRDVATGQDRRSLTTHSFSVYATAFSTGGHWFATGGKENTVKLWEVATGRELSTLDPNGGFVNAVAFSPDERLLVSASLSGRITIWEVATGNKLRDLPGTGGSVNSVAFSPDGKWLVSGSNDQTIRRWNVADGSEVRLATGHGAEVNGVAFGPDGKWIVSGSADQTVAIWDTVTGNKRRSLSGHTGEVLAVAVSPDGQWIASGSTDKAVKIWNASTGTATYTLTGHTDEVKTVAFSIDGRLVASGSKDSTIKLWDAATGKLVNTLAGHTSEVYSLAFSADGRWFASGSDDGSTRIWDAKTGDATATLVSLRESAAGLSFSQTDWLVVAPDGLFDGSPGAWHQILWRFERDTFNIRPVEIFFNEFFYPGLLGDILAGKKPRAPQDISQIDRRQPLVTLALGDEKAFAGKEVAVRDLAVKIEVAEAAPDKDHPAGCGVRDVRLFRNGSLVKIWRGDVLANKGSKAVLETTIPVIAGANELTVYAFNRDNIKSSDATTIINGAASLKRQATAYLIAVGLNTYENAGYNLHYAVPDATDFSEEVRRNQENLLGQFASVQIIPLADSEATKANILTALHRLAGNEEPLPAQAPPALLKLKAAQPEDALVIFFAGHGEAYESRFYMLPHDLGYTGSPKRMKQADFDNMMAHSISDRELEQAVEKINAGQILLVIDACHSGQALESEEARHGPMNSKGLAQLAYEKGMYILTAAQSNQAALEAAELGHGLLTYALVEEGLKKAAADRAPRDGRVLLQEWLDYATERVPQLQVEKMRQKRSTGAELAFVEGEEGLELLKRNLQRPRAFYRRDLPVPLIAISQQAPVQNRER
jgi:WD40 repeat protein